MLNVSCKQFFKEQLSNIWSSIHEKVHQRWGWVKKALLIKKCNLSLIKFFENFWLIGYCTHWTHCLFVIHVILFKTGAISALFKILGNLCIFMDSLKTSVGFLEKRWACCSIIFSEISPEIIDLPIGKALNAFFTSFSLITRTEVKEFEGSRW